MSREFLSASTNIKSPVDNLRREHLYPDKNVPACLSRVTDV